MEWYHNDVIDQLSKMSYVFSESFQLKGHPSKSSITEHFSSSAVSQPHSNISSKGDRITSSTFRQFQLTNEGSFYSHLDESRHREELNLIRTLAEIHCLLAEVRARASARAKTVTKARAKQYDCKAQSSL